MLTRYVLGIARGIAWSRIFYSSLIVSSSALIAPVVNSFFREKDGTAESADPKATPSATSHSVGAGGLVLLANRSDDSVESYERCDGNHPDLTKVTHVVDVHFPPVSLKPLKGLTKRHHGSAELIDLA
ncbi:hypothetical protein E2C01_087403 [Portunus trituberculatus]|uniref:Uncharacterized protein n=1 Tax=Portunus trituberculatus TaxID=210409 RepID=A0A5B7J6H8_PORTR|nr:hypothetical protein [Portunus trituberculatus]